MAEQAAKEPTMEEILSSIRRIISEGGDETESPEVGAETASLDASDQNTFDPAELLADNEQSDDGEDHLMSVDELLNSEDLEFDETTDMSDTIDIEEFSPMVDLEDVAAELDVELDLDVDNHDLSLDSFEEAPMPELQHAPEMNHEPEPAPVAAPAAPVAAAALTGGAGSALEGLVSELMKPVIKEWIDDNLPAMVERRVEAEINQIAAKVISALRD